MVLTRFFFSQSAIALSSRLLVAVTRGFEDLPGRERGGGLHFHRGIGEAGLGRALVVGLDELGGAGPAVKGGCSSKIVTDSAPLASGSVTSGPGAGYR